MFSATHPAPGGQADPVGPSSCHDVSLCGSLPATWAWAAKTGTGIPP